MKKLVVLFLAVLSFCVGSAFAAPAGVEAAVTCRILYIQDAPREGAKTSVKLKNDDNVIILTDYYGNFIEENEYYRVYEPDHGVEGWLPKRLLVPYARHLVVAETGVTVYSSPSMQYNVTDCLGKGTEILIIEEYGDFFVVNFRESSGFIHKSENVYKREDNEFYQSLEEVDGTVLTQTIAYAFPDENTYKVAFYSAGDRVEVIAELENWWVLDEGERYAFVRKDAVKLY